MLVEADGEVSRLRALLRDLVALSAIPGGWVGSAPRDVATGLVESLVGLLQLDFGFVRLCDPGGREAVEVASGDAWGGFSDWLEHHLASGSPLLGRQVMDGARDDGSPPRSGLVIPIGLRGEGGLVAVACEREDFPNESDQLLLSLASNQAAIAFQSARLIFERTAELRRSQTGLARLLSQQRALRRVATLAARQASQSEMLTAIAESAAELLGVDGIGLVRGEPDGSGVIVALSGVIDGYGLGFRIPADDESVTARVLRTGRAARLDSLEGETNERWGPVRSRGIRSVVWVPVVVEGRPWGVMSAGSSRSEPLPADTESRLGEFAELMATAIANSESRARVERLVAEQRALREVATLAARQAPQAEIFNAIAESAGKLLEAEIGLLRRDDDDSTVMVAVWGDAKVYRVGSRLRDQGTVTARVLRTGRPARVDNVDESDSEHLAAARSRGLRSVVWSPVIVEGRIWGVMSAGTTGSEPMPADTESRLAEFTKLMATAIANSESRARVDRLAGMQAALRRVATLAAHDASQEEVFTAIAESSGELLGSECSGLMRREGDGSAVVVATWGHTPGFEVGDRIDAEEDSVTTRVFRSAEPVRIDSLDEAPDDLLRPTRAMGLRSAVGTPVTVEGRLWGAIAVGTTQPEPMPVDTESRLSEFTELMATAIANAAARKEIERLAEEQASLRRVATLVAHDVPAGELFSVVGQEVGVLFGVDYTGMIRYEPGTPYVQTMATWAASGEHPPAPARSRAVAGDPTALVAETGEPARVDDWSQVPGPIAEFVRGELGVTSSVGTPIVVKGQLWGALAVHSKRGPLPRDTESRLLSFTELVATAIANTDERAAIARLTAEQAALRRVATLVAQEAPQAQIFTAIAEASAELLGSQASGLLRREQDGSAVSLATWGDPAGCEVGDRIGAEEDTVSTCVFRTGRPVRVEDLDEPADDPRAGRPVRARVEDLDGTPGELLIPARSPGLRCAVGTPVTVEGRLWGAIVVGTTSREPMPADAESRLGEFTELLATAIANSESRARADRLTDSQAALRRMAVLVAEDAPLAKVFAKATEEAAILVGEVDCGICRDEGDGNVVTLGASGGDGVLGAQPVGERFPLDGVSLTGRVIRERRYVQIDDYAATTGTIGERGQRHGIRSAAGCPIIVHGRVWGVIGIARYEGDALPPEAETRLAQLAGLVATAIANADARAEIERLAQEQAALRRVATLVAADPSSTEMFAKVAEEVAQAIGEVDCALAKVDADESITTLAASGVGPLATLPIGARFRVDGRSIVACVLREGKPCRIDDYPETTHGEIGERGRRFGIRSAAGCPIIVRGQTWGVMSVATYGDDPLPAGTERRVEQFTDLVATAIANAGARAEIERLAQEQAALRRVATLVAEQASPGDVFAAVVEQVGLLVDADGASMTRYLDEDKGRIVASWGRKEALPVGVEFPLREGIACKVGRTRSAARIDDYASNQEDVPAFVRDTGVRSAVGAPIVVAGQVWGALVVGSYAPNKWPPDAESKIEEFTELAATAVSNMQARADLAASRERIVTAGDEARRRIERDLHDGIQQRLVSLALKLRGAETMVAAGDPLAGELADLGVALDGVSEELRELSRGIHPAILREGGLDAAIRGLARRSGVPVVLNIALDGRLSETTEVAAYYVVSEALTNAAKHARASRAEVALEFRDEMLEVSIRDDGVGGAHPVPGSGLAGLSDRVEAIGGTIRLSSPPGKGTVLGVSFPTGLRVDAGRDKQAKRDRRGR